MIVCKSGTCPKNTVRRSWADVLPGRQLAVGSAAINTLWQIGAFLSLYAWGVTKDATGSVRTRVMSERRERAAAIEQLAVTS